MAGDGSRRSDYRQARIGAAAALVGVVVLIVIVDAFSVAYELSPVVLAALLGTVAALVGVELRGLGK